MTHNAVDHRALALRQRQDALDRTKAMLAQFRTNIYLNHPQLEAIELDLEGVLAFGPPEKGNPQPARTYLLVGASGAGKSTILHRFLARHPPVKEVLRDLMEVVYAEVPASATRSGTIRAILEGLGVSPKARATEADLTRSLVHYLRGMGVRVLILDEAQHLMDWKTGRFAYDTADWLKTLSNSGLSIVIAGTPEASMAYHLNEQLGRRSMGQAEIESFPWGGPDPQSEWMMIVEALAPKIPLLNASLLLEGDIPHRLHLATAGYLGRLVDFMALIIMEAGKQGATAMDRHLLMAVEQRRRDLDDPEWVNVFALVSLADYEAPVRDTSRRTRIRRGRRLPRQEDVGHLEAV
ncbi:TniB family NTP-binding protein [Muricoccus radiodurans]|uniref:TniB family NTP-binding protein n=1 Tax=Muricoccus radiodurans TaxID=2231721 RepID=UPI003CF71307